MIGTNSVFVVLVPNQKIALPPIIKNEERKKQIITTFRKSRKRYRMFRARLAEEITQSDGELFDGA